MKTDLTQTEVLYKFNTDFDDSDNSYCFVLMTSHEQYMFQILLNYSISRITILVMKPHMSGMSVDHSVKPLSINLSGSEISSGYEIKKAISELINGLGCSMSELHPYMKDNLDTFLSDLLNDAGRRGLIRFGSECKVSKEYSQGGGCFAVLTMFFSCMILLAKYGLSFI